MPRGGPRLRTKDKRLNQVGGRVSESRLRAGMEQDTLCARLAALTDGEWSPGWQDISRIENGARIVSDLEVLTLAAALGCTACWLLVGGNGD